MTQTCACFDGNLAAPYKSFRSFLLWFSMVWAVALSSAAHGNEGCDEVFFFSPDVDYGTDIQPILNQHCVHCHQPGGSGYNATLLDLRPGLSWGHLVRVPSRQDSEELLVRPAFFLSESLLFNKLNCNEPRVGMRMPLDEAPLSLEDQIRFFLWISGGASPSDTPTGLPVNKGLAGSWFNPATPGQGFSLEIVWPSSEEEAGLLILYWFTFHSAPELGSRWFFVDGSFETGESVIELTVYESQGGRFDAASPAPELRQVGSAELRIMSCRRARFEYLINENGASGSPIFGTIMLERLSPVDPACLEMETTFVEEQS